MIKVALLSQWHVHARDYARQAIANPDLEIVAVWDEVATRGELWATELGVTFYPDLDALLERRDIDAAPHRGLFGGNEDSERGSPIRCDC